VGTITASCAVTIAIAFPVPATLTESGGRGVVTVPAAFTGGRGLVTVRTRFVRAACNLAVGTERREPREARSAVVSRF
jgi:hypothetical protein